MNKDAKSELGGKQSGLEDRDRDDAAQLTDHEPRLDIAIQKHLGRKLQATYSDLVNQPVPDKFRQLLDELERQEKKQ